MINAERDHLLHRIALLERANRRWRLLALAGTPLLALLLLLAVGNGIACYVMFRDARQREQQARVEAERARDRAEVARMQAISAAARLAREQAENAAKMPQEP
jgi:hypothetical protein